MLPLLPWLFFIALAQTAYQKELWTLRHVSQYFFIYILRGIIHVDELLSSCSKCQHYSPNESNKAYDKTITRKAGVMFEPKLVIEEVKSETLGRRSLKSKEEYLKQYIAVRLSLRHTVYYQVLATGVCCALYPGA